ncbi:15200_t:CDS:2, partial [Funneliformis caledonium]
CEDRGYMSLIIDSKTFELIYPKFGFDPPSGRTKSQHTRCQLDRHHKRW